MTDTEAQSKQILRYLRAGHRITPLEALKKFRTLRLGARIYDLRQDGHKIQRRLVEVSEGKRVAEYWLEGKAA